MSNPKRQRSLPELEQLATERVNPRTAGLDRLRTPALVRALQREDATVAGTVRGCAPAIAAAIDQMAARFQQGGRIIYVGAGSSGRLGVLDAAECPPTFGVARGRVVGVIAGGARALQRSIEGAEDDAGAGGRDLARLRLTPADTVVGIAASGRTPYTVAALHYARRRGCLIVAIACSPGSPLAAVAGGAGIAIEAVTGAEALTGSTRLKAGTAQKMILNQLSTGVMVRAGRVRGNLMTGMQPTNGKLQARAQRILAAALGGDVTPARARRLLAQSGGDLQRALRVAAANSAREQ